MRLVKCKAVPASGNGKEVVGQQNMNSKAPGLRAISGEKLKMKASNR